MTSFRTTHQPCKVSNTIHPFIQHFVCHGIDDVPHISAKWRKKNRLLDFIFLYFFLFHNKQTCLIFWNKSLPTTMGLSMHHGHVNHTQFWDETCKKWCKYWKICLDNHASEITSYGLRHLLIPTPGWHLTDPICTSNHALKCTLSSRLVRLIHPKICKDNRSLQPCDMGMTGLLSINSQYSLDPFYYQLSDFSWKVSINHSMMPRYTQRKEDWRYAKIWIWI